MKGIFVTPVAPLNSDLTLDENGVKESIRFLVDNNINAIVPCGSIGEWSSLTDAEQGRITQLTIDEVNSKVPVIVGVSSTSTFETVEKARRAEDMGADGLLVVPPFYLKYHLEGLVKHYQMIATKTNLDIILYNSPDFVGFDMPAVDMEYVVNKVPHITAIKDSTTDMVEFACRMATMNSTTRILLGNEPYCYFGLLLGSDGAFTSMASFLPEPILAMYDHIQKGELQKAKEIYLRLAPYIEFRRRTRNPIAVVKQAMIYSGIRIQPYVRPPIVELSEEQKSKLKRILQTLLTESEVVGT